MITSNVLTNPLWAVHAIKRTLGDTANVGTVDKFQGQEAPIVIYSLWPEEAASSLFEGESCKQKVRLLELGDFPWLDFFVGTTGGWRRASIATAHRRIDA